MKKGITFMALVIMIAIILTFATTAVVSGVNSLNNSRKIQYASELSYVQEVITSYKNVNTDFSFDEVSVVDLTDASQDVRQQFSDEFIDNNKVSLYKVNPDLEILRNSSLTFGNGNDEDDVFLYSENTGKIYYKKGIELNGKLYYTLTDELKNKIDYSLVSENKSGNIIFVKNTDVWTASNVSCQIKIPNNLYTNVSVHKLYVNSTGQRAEENLSISSKTANYDIYNVVAESNCSIRVDYTTSDSVRLSSTYNIDNIDTVYPVLEVSDIKTKVEPETNKVQKYIEILKREDNQSGIKRLKYEKTKIDNPTYFSENGISFDSDVIDIPDYVENVTIYIEDNAGNYKMIKK